jgi:hypothetical protein
MTHTKFYKLWVWQLLSLVLNTQETFAGSREIIRRLKTVVWNGLGGRLFECGVRNAELLRSSSGFARLVKFAGQAE